MSQISDFLSLRGNGKKKHLEVLRKLLEVALLIPIFKNIGMAIYSGSLRQRLVETNM